MDQEELQYDGDGADETFTENGDEFADDADRSAMESELEAIKGKNFSPMRITLFAYFGLISLFIINRPVVENC